MTLSLQRSYHICDGRSMCVALKHRLVVVSQRANGCRLQMFSLATGLSVRTIGSYGNAKGQLNFLRGGLCVSPDGECVLVAERFNSRVQQLQIADGAWVRHVMAEGVSPDVVDCNANVIVAAGPDSVITVFSWATGCVQTQLAFNGICVDIRLLADGSGFVGTDSRNRRLRVLSLHGGKGQMMSSEAKHLSFLTNPCAALECVLDGSFLVANCGNTMLTKLSRNGAVVGACSIKRSSDDTEFIYPIHVAAIAGQDYAVMFHDFNEHLHMRFGVVRDHSRRLAWLGICVAAASPRRNLQQKGCCCIL